MNPTVLIADDSPVMRSMIRSAIEAAGGRVAGEAGDGLELKELYFQLKPDLVTVDLNMPRQSGVEAMVEILMGDPLAKILVVTAFGEASVKEQVLRMGAKAVVDKPFRPEELVQAIQHILSDARPS
ncbi:MAG: response regulator [Elusimicrobia bacterium]|nr:response regulator [Elusimicrobiota bacterium]